MILKVVNLKKFFGGITAVSGVSFGLEEGEVSSIIGPNGAGKTTLFNLITGKIRPDDGKVLFKDEDITGLKPQKICFKKIGRSFQRVNIFPRLSAFENIQIAILSMQGRIKNFLNQADRMVQAETMEILESLEVADKKDAWAGVLAHGDQKRLDIGVALACQPELVLLDEPTAGMSPGETRRITELIRKLANERGLTILLIEHDMEVVFSISKVIRVMHEGKLIAEGTPEEIRNNDEVQRIYLGEQS